MHDLSATASSPAPGGATASGPGIPIVAGLALMVGALGLDIVGHAGPLAALEPVAHVAGVLGMAITWLAVVLDGTTHHRTRPR